MRTQHAVLVRATLAAVLLLLLNAVIYSQTPPANGIVSPEVHADHSVTFRISAPKASELMLYGDWMPVGQPQPMTKGSDGVWSVTTTPLEANVHLYWFILDGVAIADPINPVIKLRQRTSASLVEIPATPPAALGTAGRAARHSRDGMAEVSGIEPNRAHRSVPAARLRDVQYAVSGALPGTWKR